jgi:FkbM family methyltransferase
MPTSVEAVQRLGRSCRGTIHVGASSGQEIANYHASGLSWVIMVEPLLEPFTRLRESIKGIPNYFALQALCAAREGIEYEFHVASNDGQSSSILSPSRHITEHPDVTFTETIPLRSTTVDRIMMQLTGGVPGFTLDAIDILYMDVQGAELEVLKGSTKTLQSVDYVFSEVSYGGLYQHDACIEDVQAFLRCFGFRLNWVDINQHGWGDALFIRP